VPEVQHDVAQARGNAALGFGHGNRSTETKCDTATDIGYMRADGVYAAVRIFDWSDAETIAGQLKVLAEQITRGPPTFRNSFNAGRKPRWSLAPSFGALGKAIGGRWKDANQSKSQNAIRSNSPREVAQCRLRTATNTTVSTFESLAIAIQRTMCGWERI
jgi:hypothetical protein